nr:MAG TPA: hypothetical protein [Caudoviricetes sp.]
MPLRLDLSAQFIKLVRGEIRLDYLTFLVLPYRVRKYFLDEAEAYIGALKDLKKKINTSNNHV